MIAYNQTTLDNLALHAQLDQATEENCISAAEDQVIRKRYPVDFYSPNIYARIGLFVLTCIAVSFSFGLLSIASTANERVLGGSLILYGIGTICLLEYIIRTKKHHQSGVDDALLWIAAGLFLGGFFLILQSPSTGWICLVILLISTAAVLRYADRVMLIIAYAAVVCLIVNILFTSGPVIKSMIPFVVMAVSFLVYFFSARSLKNPVRRFYHSCLRVLKTASLLGVYLAGNYFIVRELEQMLVHGNVGSSRGSSIVNMFWVTTLLVPVIYLYLGIRKKDTIFLWLGLILTAATVATIRYYHSFMPPEIAMTIGGVLLIIFAYGCFRYFRSPRFGITEKKLSGDPIAQVMRLESLLAAQLGSVSASPADASHVEFGGGSGGGGGAGGSY